MVKARMVPDGNSRINATLWRRQSPSCSVQHANRITQTQVASTSMQQVLAEENDAINTARCSEHPVQGRMYSPRVRVQRRDGTARTGFGNSKAVLTDLQASPAVLSERRTAMDNQVGAKAPHAHGRIERRVDRCQRGVS